MKIKILFFLFSISSSVFAHSDYTFIEDYGNVRVSFTTGFSYEERNRALIIGQLAEKLSTEMGYKGQLYLYFRHNYTNDWNTITDYFISYDKIEIGDRENKKELNSLIIRQFGKCFDVKNTLKLVENIISNQSEIEKQQKPIKYEKYYNDMRFNSIDSISIDKVLSSETSNRVLGILKNKIERPKKINSEIPNLGVSYYWQDGKYYLFLKELSEEIPIMTLDNIYYLRNMNLHDIVFDSDSSFYLINRRSSEPFVYKRKVIKDIQNIWCFYQPFNVNVISYNKVSLSISYNERREDQPFYFVDRVLIYYPDNDILIQDLDKLILPKDKIDDPR